MKIYNVLIALAIAIAFMLFVRTYTGVKAADLANPGTLNLTQIDSYPVCSPSIPNSSSPSYSTCKVGEGSNWQGLLLAKSINQNESVSFYEYYIPPALTEGELFSPVVVTYPVNRFLFNSCGLSLYISNINYGQQYFTFTAIKNSSAGGCLA